MSVSKWRREGSRVTFSCEEATATLVLNSEGELRHIEFGYAGSKIYFTRELLELVNSLLAQLAGQGIRWEGDGRSERK